jgi:tyrosyl-tRNA synthetase
MESDDDPLAGDPLDAKLALARWIVARAHGLEAARAAEGHFTRVVREGLAPDDTPVVEVAGDIVHLPALLATHFGNSRSYWRRVIAQSGVRLNGQPVMSFDIPSVELEGRTLHAGKRHFLRLRAKRQSDPNAH